MTSFRTRIQYGALGLIVVLLFILDLALYLGFKHVLNAYIDSRLEAMAQTWAEIIGNSGGILLTSLEQQETSMVPEAMRSDESLTRSLSIAVLSPDGRVLWRSPSILPSSIRDASIPPDGLLDGRRVFETIELDNGVAVRRVWSLIQFQSGVRYILQAETHMGLIRNALTWLQVLLLAGSVVVLGLAWIGSSWLARQALLPIEALSSTAHSIAETSSLNTRLELNAPYVEFRRLAEVFNSMMDRLQLAFEGQRRFVTDAAHELHTPLTALKGNLEVAFARNRNAREYRETLIGNLASVDRLIHLCRSLITLAKLTGHERQPPRQFLAIAPLLREVVEELRVLADDRRIGIRMEFQAVPDIYGNQEQLQRVFVNLLDNALRHTASDGMVTATLFAADAHVVLTVEDTGEGIPVEHLSHIFDRFYRTDSARSRESGGVGLGLSIVQEIVTGHGGDITVSSELHKGTRFTIKLPAPQPTRAVYSGHRSKRGERRSHEIVK